MKTELILSQGEVEEIMSALDRAELQGAEDLQVHIDLNIDTKKKKVSHVGMSIYVYGTCRTEYLEKIK